MRSRVATWLAWSLAGLSVTMFGASAALFLLARSAPVPASWDANLSLGVWLAGVPFLIFSLVGALIASRRPRNPIGWLLLAEGLLSMLIGVLDYYAVYGVAQPGSVPFPVEMAGINNWLWVPAFGLLGTYVFLLFPNGRLPSRRWLPLAWLSGVVIVLLSAYVALEPGPLHNLGGVRNPFGLEGHTWVTTVGFAVPLLLPLCMLASALSLVLRYRRSGGEERQQIKWIAFAASVVGLSFLIGMVTSFVFPSAWSSPDPPLWIDLMPVAVLGSFQLVPIAVGFAVLRYRLYDIDLIINRALIYGALTVSLVLVYAGSVVGLQHLFRALIGRESQLAVVASTLAIAALFNPLRRRIQATINRRFYRRKYDAAKTLEALSARLRDETDLEALSRDLESVARETVQPAHVSVWLREPGRRARETGPNNGRAREGRGVDPTPATSGQNLRTRGGA